MFTKLLSSTLIVSTLMAPTKFDDQLVTVENEIQVVETKNKEAVVTDTNVQTGKVEKFTVQATQTTYEWLSPKMERMNSVTTEVYIPFEESVSPRDSQSQSKTEAGVTATVTANYSVTNSSGTFTWYSFSGSWVPNQSYNLISNRSCGAVEYAGGGKSTVQHPGSNSFAYTLNWSCSRILGQNPRVWSEATITPTGMGSASHIIELYMEF